MRILLAEITHRWFSSCLAILAVATAVCLALVVMAVSEGTERETRRIQRDIGLNVRILPAGTDLGQYWMTGASASDMPAEYIERVTNQSVANRLIPMLRRPIDLDGRLVMLVGIADEQYPTGLKKKDVFSQHVPPSGVVLGHAVAGFTGSSAGDSLEILGKPLKVDRVLSPTGTREDASVYVELAVAQNLLDLPGRINEIQAIECHCEIGESDPLGRLRTTLQPLMPDTIVVRQEQAADARRWQRYHAEGFLAIFTPIVLVLCAIWVAALAVGNVRERRSEIGVLRAVGRSAGSVALLLLGRWFLLGIDGAILGFFAGLLLVDIFGPQLFPITGAGGSSQFVSWWMLAVAVGVAPLCAMSASAIPVALAMTRDPARDLAPA